MGANPGAIDQGSPARHTGDARAQSGIASRWVVVGLLLLSVCINYIDRGSLSVAVPVLKNEFGLSAKQLGFLLSAFFWSYTVMQLVVGPLVDRYDVKWIYAAGFLVWSMAMAGTGLVHGFATLFAARLFLGIGESVFLPSVSRIVVRLFPAECRGLPNALVDVGTKVGPALSVLIGGLVVKNYGWRVLFIVIGLGSLVWLLPWMALMPGAAQRKPTQTENDPPASPVTQPQPQEPRLPDLLRRRELWGTSLAMFALGYVWIFLLTWLPDYLVKERGFSPGEMSVLGSLPYWGMAATSLTGGWGADRLIAAGFSQTAVRKSIALTGLILCAGLLLPVGFARDRAAAIGFLIAACIALGLFTSNVWAITQTLAGPEAAGKWTGIQNFIGNLGAVSPIAAGFIVESTGSFFLAFVVATVILVLGASAYWLLIPRIERVL